MLNNKIWWHVAYWLGGVVFVFVGLWVYQYSYAQKIYPGVRCGQIDLGGLTTGQAEDKLNKTWDNFNQQGILVKYGSEQTLLKPLVVASENPDLVYELISFQPEVVSKTAWQEGRGSNWFNNLIQPILFKFWRPDVSYLTPVEIQADRVVSYLNVSFKDLETTPAPAAIKINLEDDVEVVKEQPGLVVDKNALVKILVERAVNFSNEPITIEQQPIAPELTEAKVLEALPEVKQVLKNQDIILSFEDNTWRAKAADWHKWLAVRLTDDKQVQVYLDQKLAVDFFKKITETVNQEAHDAKFELSNDKVKVFEASQEGRKVEVDKTLSQIWDKIKADKSLQTELVVVKTQPQVTTDKIAGLDVKEIIGTGRSSFKGSPTNRRHNIKNGAAMLNGLIIKPDEEFSLINNLGTIDEAGGYLPELVIKGDKTVPEFGGGLCQIGTTTFRAALSSGLPILERRNHSYRVSYYEPAGTDATIYDPKPDFRFKNDTGHNILIQTKIKGDDLTFEFWGTKDGRTVVQTKPEIYNIVKPPPTKLVETLDLPVGTKKCTETAHSGADAEFTYTVTYADGNNVEKVFKSHYVPWQEVCLIGVEKLSTPVENPTGDNSATEPTPTN